MHTTAQEFIMYILSVHQSQYCCLCSTCHHLTFDLGLVTVDSVMACFMITAFVLSWVIANIAVIGMLLAFLEAILVELEGQIPNENSQNQHVQVQLENGEKLADCNSDGRQESEADAAEDSIVS